jgi:putative sterol carrier protein
VVSVSSFGGFDPDRALEKLRKLAADAPAYMADGFGRVVHNAPPERLEQLMRSPARKPALDGIFWQMPKQVNTEVAKDMTTTIRWRITGRPDDGVDVYQLVVDKGQVKTVKGESGEPKLTVTMDAVEFLKLASGNLDPMQAYFKGRIELTGDIMVAAKLAQLFKLPGGNGGAGGDGMSDYDDPPEGDPSGGDPSGGNPSGGNPSGGNPSGGNPSGGNPTPFSPPPAS